MKRIIVILTVLALLALSANVVLAERPDGFDNNGKTLGLVGDAGFDEFGYNYAARIFSGPADGVDRVLDGKVYGDPTYANDHLVMKWSQAWDDARFHGAPWTSDAWENNEWNGAVPGGSGEVWHYKIVWFGDCVDLSPLPDGGYCFWKQFDVIMDQGTDPGGHSWYAHAVPTGYGAFPQ
jgi:hypothetical protein